MKRVTRAELVEQVKDLNTALTVERRAREDAEQRVRIAQAQMQTMEPMPKKATINYGYSGSWEPSPRETWQQQYNDLSAEQSRVIEGLRWLHGELRRSNQTFARFVAHLLRWPDEPETQR